LKELDHRDDSKPASLARCGNNRARPSNRQRNSRSFFRVLWSDERAAQMVEFAVSLPLLIVFVVGIFDFSNAYTFKQKLTNVARDAARAAAADPSSDLGNSLPASIADAYQIINSYLLANQISPCSMTMGPTSGTTWTITGNPCANGILTITINRGYYFQLAENSNTPATAGCQSAAVGTQPSVVATCVSIQYPYQWQFGRVASLLGGNTFLPPNITAIAVAVNEN
jgi:Flp pilus assembly protein TadG